MKYNGHTWICEKGDKCKMCGSELSKHNWIGTYKDNKYKELIYFCCKKHMRKYFNKGG